MYMYNLNIHDRINIPNQSIHPNLFVYLILSNHNTFHSLKLKYSQSHLFLPEITNSFTPPPNKTTWSHLHRYTPTFSKSSNGNVEKAITCFTTWAGEACFQQSGLLYTFRGNNQWESRCQVYLPAQSSTTCIEYWIFELILH